MPSAPVNVTSVSAVSIALDEYVSVSTQRDTEPALLAKERHELSTMPEAELEELTAIYQAKGLSPTTARTVAEELAVHDAFAAHAEAELGIDPDELTDPWHAAFEWPSDSLLVVAMGSASALAEPAGLLVDLARDRSDRLHSGRLGWTHSLLL